MATEEVKKKVAKKVKQPPRPEDLALDVASQDMIARSREMEIDTIFDRAQTMKPCNIGAQGTCCKNCAQGPCRLPLPKGGIEGEDTRKGLCGATAHTIAARNFARMVAGGAAAHSDHGRGVAEAFLAAARKEVDDYHIKDTKKLLEIAPDYGVDITVEGKNGVVCTALRAPKPRVELWKKLGVLPRGIDREIVEIMHRTHIGVDQHYENLVMQCSRAAIGDGWGGSMIATDLQDVLFGCPYPVKSTANLGVMKEDHVNIVIHGHEPLLSEMIVQAADLPEMIDLAKKKGANGIQLSGICCTANELLMRHGIPLCGDFLQQELAIITGAVDAMVVDIQCIMENIASVAQCFHTKIITTNPRARIASGDTIHIEFDEHNAFEDAKKIVRTAIENFPNREKEVMIPDEKSDLIAGFSYEAIEYHLGGTFRGSYSTLNDNIINGRIRGIGGVVG
jgi:anaerobic carbon-monoxide dehydrogenase catalytic subunit